MKKSFTFIFIAALTLTVLNVSKIDTKNSVNIQLSSLFESAHAETEGGGGCYEQLYYADLTNYEDLCNYAMIEFYQCVAGTEPECSSGELYTLVSNCQYTSGGNIKNLTCP